MSVMPGVEQIPITSREQWLKLREQDVTASTAGALLGVHEYTSAFHLWAIKSALLSDDIEETAPMVRGRLLEPVALQLIREQRPTWRIEPGKHYYRHAEYRIGATPDAFAADPARPGMGNVQIKTVEPGVFRRNWREDGEVAVPLWIAVQAIVEAKLTGCTWACVAAMRVGFGLDLDIIEIPLNDNVWRATVAAVAEFWRRVESGEGYPPDYAKDGAVIAARYAKDDGSEVDLSSDNRIGVILEERAKLKDLEKAGSEAEIARKALDAEIIDKLGKAAAGRLADGTLVTAKTIKRTNKVRLEETVSIYRQVAVKDPPTGTVRQPREKAA